MSIFKSTFKPFVVRQISARQNLLAQKDRTVEFSKYVSAKAPWIRMTSFVDYGDEGKESSDLAKKYILLGGTLYKFDTENNTAFMRSGVGGAGASYGGDLGSRQYGIRPMPGITSMTTRSLGAYGSLTEATVKFYAWDVKQLEDLSVLFLRPGYKVLLEWGWSMYLDTSIQGESPKDKTNYKTLNTDYNKFTVQNTPFNTIDCFNENITQDQIYDQLQTLRHKYSGNYDGVLGSIRNFEYELMPNGGYECTTVVLSIGDVIDTIRMNDTVGLAIPSSQQEDPTKPEIKSQFELLFDGYTKLSKSNTRNLKRNSFIAYIDSEIKTEDAPYIDTNIYTNASSESLTTNNLFNLNVTTQTPETVKVDQPISSTDNIPLDQRYNHFIQLAYLVHILNTFKNLFSQKNQKQIDIEIPSSPLRPNTISNGLCQASFNSVSINPSVVLIKNSKATVFKNQNDINGFNPPLRNAEDPFSLESIEEYLYPDTNLGSIGNLYINIGKVVSLYKELSLSGNGYVYVGTFISKLMSDVSFALGSINDFDKFVTDNKICIIDKHYTELPSDSSVSSKFKINVLGNASIVRSHKINSKIFPSQATMIAIAAQSRENVASLQTSTYNYLNRKLKDRLFNSTENQKDDLQESNEIQLKRNKVNQILTLVQFVKDYVLTNKSMSVFHDGNISAMNGYLNTLLVEIDGGTDYKGVIPISVDLTIDGLSGLTIGEIFTLDKNVLPKDYKSKSIGFIVTKITNEVVSNAWKTSIGSQICILDQQNLQIASKEKARIILQEITAEIAKNIADNTLAMKIFNALAAFASDYFAGGLKLDASGNIERTLKTVYTSTALREYPIQSGGGSLTAAEFLEYFSNLLRTYKKPDAQQLFYLGYSIDLYSDRVKDLLVSPPIIRNIDGETVTRGEPLATVGTSTIEIKTFDQLIKDNIFYNQMPSQLKTSFDAEYRRVKELFSAVLNKKALQDIEDNTAFGSIMKVIDGTTSPKGENLIIQFGITNPKDVDQITGNIPVPTPLYSGYTIYNESKSRKGGPIRII